MSKSFLSIISSLNKSLLKFAPLLPTLIPILIDLWITTIDKKTVIAQNWKLEYDFIIVGAGTAGSMIAYELAKNGKNILLIEAGGNDNFFSDIPALSHLLQQTEMDWQYMTEPQDNACLGLTDRRSRWPRGRVMGGSSTIDNDMLYVNGNPEDYNQWAEQMGAKNWSWEDIRWDFPFKQKNLTKRKDLTAEDIEADFERRINERLTLQSYQTSFNKQLVRAFIQSGRKLNYNFVEYNTKSEIGFSYPLVSIKRGKRYSEAKEYLSPNFKIDNLDIVNYAFVNKIIIENMTATGVHFERFGYSYTIRAKREVILSAGAINSPQLLMLSGIGPKKHLESFGIPVIKDLPVGHNLQDQYGTQLTFSANIKSIINANKDINSMQFLKYILFSEGLLSTAPVEAIAYIKTDKKSDRPVPDIQLILKPLGLTSDKRSLMKKLYGINDNFWQYFSKHENKELFSIFINLLHPKSRGTIELKSTDPKISPKIKLNYFSDTEDMKTIINGLEFVNKLIKTKPFESLRVESLGKPNECKKFTDSDKKEDKKFYECYARHLTLTAHSPIGTCRMGDPSSNSSVVDPELNVIGISGLRVADASIMPSQISGGPSAAVQMIGQHLASIIIQNDAEVFKEKFEKLEDFVENGFNFAYNAINNYFN